MSILFTEAWDYLIWKSISILFNKDLNVISRKQDKAVTTRMQIFAEKKFKKSDGPLKILLKDEFFRFDLGKLFKVFLKTNKI